MDALLSRRLRIAIDDRIKAEYREVLARPRLGLETIRREPVEAILQLQVHVAALPWSDPTPPDEDDTMFLEVALQTSERTVVTGNLNHFPAACRNGVTVLSPREAGEQFAQIHNVGVL